MLKVLETASSKTGEEREKDYSLALWEQHRHMKLHQLGLQILQNK